MFITLVLLMCKHIQACPRVSILAVLCAFRCLCLFYEYAGFYNVSWYRVVGRVLQKVGLNIFPRKLCLLVLSDASILHSYFKYDTKEVIGTWITGAKQIKMECKKK